MVSGTWSSALTVLLCAGCGRVGFDAVGEPGVAGSGFRKSLTIGPGRVGGADLIDFVVLVSIASDPELRTTASGGGVAHVDGHDLVFVDTDGGQLDHELAQYDGSNGTVIAWVRLPTVSATQPTTWFLYYGNGQITAPTERPAAVWTGGYAGVWHLDETMGTRRDSTRSANHVLEQIAPIAGSTEAVIGGAADIRTENANYLGMPDASQTGLDGTGAMTISFWTRAIAQFTGYRNVISKWEAGDDSVSVGNCYYVAEDTFGAGHRFKFRMEDDTGATAIYGTSVLALDTWYHLAAVYDGVSMQAYVDGIEDAVAVPRATGARDGTAEFDVGGKATAPAYGHHGQLDEVRISSVARTASWLRAEHDNQRTPSAFVTIGPQERL